MSYEDDQKRLQQLMDEYLSDDCEDFSDGSSDNYTPSSDNDSTDSEPPNKKIRTGISERYVISMKYRRR